MDGCRYFTSSYVLRPARVGSDAARGPLTTRAMVSPSRNLVKGRLPGHTAALAIPTVAKGRARSGRSVPFPHLELPPEPAASRTTTPFDVSKRDRGCSAKSTAKIAGENIRKNPAVHEVEEPPPARSREANLAFRGKFLQQPPIPALVVHDPAKFVRSRGRKCLSSTPRCRPETGSNCGAEGKAVLSIRGRRVTPHWGA